MSFPCKTGMASASGAALRLPRRGAGPLSSTSITHRLEPPPHLTAPAPVSYNGREMPGLSYEQSGVDYDRLDAFKRACQQAAASTTGALKAHGLSEPPAIRGESAYLIETPDEYLAHVEEGLGTKNIVADAMLKLTGKSFYRNIGIDTVATIVNDLVTTGALPLSVAMHAAVGDAAWFAGP